METLGSGGEQILIYEREISGLGQHPLNTIVHYFTVFVILPELVIQRGVKIKKVIAGFPEVKSTDLLQIMELLLQTLIGAPEIQTSLAEHADGKIHFLNHDAVIVGGQDMV